MTARYSTAVNRKVTPQNAPIPGRDQVANNAGGFVYKLDEWARLERFLILGADGNTYYVGQKDLLLKNASLVTKLIAEDGPRVVLKVVEISTSYRAPKNAPAVFVLALAAQLGDSETKRIARQALATVCRTGTDLFQWVDVANSVGGWGRGLRKAVSAWYNRDVGDVAYQAVKYQSRRTGEGDKTSSWSHRDVLRLAHTKPRTEDHNSLFKWIVKGTSEGLTSEGLKFVRSYEEAKAATSEQEVVNLIKTYGLTREWVPTQWRNKASVWEALLPNLPATALLRNLANMTRYGTLKPLSANTSLVVGKLGDTKFMRRVHPLAILVAQRTYISGYGKRGVTWTPIPAIVDALDRAFYASFKLVTPTGLNHLLALDVSGSMGGGTIAGATGVSPAVASAAMALVTANVEHNTHIIGFTDGGGKGFTLPGGGHYPRAVSELTISPRQRLDDVCNYVASHRFGRTDCAVPMLYALEQKLDVDVFVIYTDNETWFGDIHPSQALAKYRNGMNKPNAKLVVCGMTATEFTIADPLDSGSLDVVGFDSATPQLISTFVKG
jgi:60 kDa SS-A/Ro ribonucleoprotein